MSSSTLLTLLFHLMLLLPESEPLERLSRIVETKQGRIQGRLIELRAGFSGAFTAFPAGGRKNSSAGGGDKAEVEVYRGMPFAAAPVGSLRFMPPVTSSPWSRLRSAGSFAPVCPQMWPDVTNRTEAAKHMPEGRIKDIIKTKELLANQSEDCLYLNVYAEKIGSSSSGRPAKHKLLRPVMVFIHGDSYQWGSGNIYDGSVLAALGKVVVVTLNYRLGILGFLNTNNDEGDNRAPSNLGILDQIAALHWVHENIEQFGGDPSNVTLMGHGSGAACVHFLMTSEALADGYLFHRVILMSGSALSPWSVVKNSWHWTSKLAGRLNCSTKTSRHLLQCLRSAPLSTLLRAAQTVSTESDSSSGDQSRGAGSSSSSPYLPAWGPTFDGLVVHSFRHRMRDYLERMSRYGLLFGCATADALFRFGEKQLQFGMSTEDRNKMLSEFVAANYERHQREIFSAIVTEYTDWQSSTRRPVSIRDGTMEALGDAMYSAPIIETGDYHASLSKKSWFYVFDYQTRNSLYKQRQGAVHGELLKYVFGLPLVSTSSSSSSSDVHVEYMENEVLLSKATVLYWSNFAASGDPNKRGGDRILTSSSLPTEWNSYDPKFKKYLHIGMKFRTRDHYRSQKMALWLNLVPDLQSAALAQTPMSASDIDVESNRKQMADYKLYDELLPFVPKLKTLLSYVITTPASSEVLWPTHNNQTSSAGILGHAAGQGVGVGRRKNQPRHNENGSGMTNSSSTFLVHTSPKSLSSNYSTALSVTIAIGCSLLVLNVLIFSAVYYQRDRSRDLDLEQKLAAAVGGHGHGHVKSKKHSFRAAVNANHANVEGTCGAAAAANVGHPEGAAVAGGACSNISQFIELRRPHGNDDKHLMRHHQRQQQHHHLQHPANFSSNEAAEQLDGSRQMLLLHGRRSLPDVSPPDVPPRKSALKGTCIQQQQQQQQLRYSSSNLQHLPPPEFADEDDLEDEDDEEDDEERSQQHHLSVSSEMTVAKNSSGVATSFQTLPYRQSSSGACILGLTPTPTTPTTNASQHLLNQQCNGAATLPLKSSLKKKSVPPRNANAGSASWMELKRSEEEEELRV